jgi:hypothetical protein
MRKIETNSSWNDNLCLWSADKHIVTSWSIYIYDQSSITPLLSFLPLNIVFEPGMVIYSILIGSAGFPSLPISPAGNSSTPVKANSIVPSSDVWASTNVDSNNCVVFWDSVPDVSQLAVSGSLHFGGHNLRYIFMCAWIYRRVASRVFLVPLAATPDGPFARFGVLHVRISLENVKRAKSDSRRMAIILPSATPSRVLPA